MIFKRFNQRVQFKNRIAAAITLSEILKGSVKKNDRKQTLVLGIPRAGVLTADIVAKRLSIPNFDIIVPRKLTGPDNKEQAIGAVIDDGFAFILHSLVNDFQISKEYLRREIAFQIHEINQRKRKYYKDPAISFLSERIREHDIIMLVDDGIATGATMTVAAKWMRQFDSRSDINRKRVIVATPVSPKIVVEQIRRECSAEVATVFEPSNGFFHSVEQYHQDFDPVTDEQVIDIMKERKII